ncbi:MAG: histidinol-phosphatase, partial [Lachnospiraceae bacterium]|nr:histidinol-phosphatase [Lachnospiraceae bacterium]
MIDFHSHFLPGLDDGSKSVEESLEMLALSWESGVDRIVATPHFYASKE